MKLSTLTAAVAVVAAAASGCGSSGEAAASVAGIDYPVGDLHDHMAALDPDSGVRAARADVAVWLQDWVFFTALGLDLAERGAAVTDADRARTREEMIQLDPSFDPTRPGGEILIQRQALVNAARQWAVDEVPDMVVDPAAVGVPDLLCSRHILVETDSEAEEVLARLGAGEAFGDLASELSLDPGSGASGGDLGCVIEGSFVPEFEDAAYSAGAGEVAVAQSDFGFHVIEVLSAGPAVAENHPDAAPEVLDSAMARAVEVARRAAQAEVDGQREARLSELVTGVEDRYAERVRVDRRYGEWDPETFRIVVGAEG